MKNIQILIVAVFVIIFSNSCLTTNKNEKINSKNFIHISRTYSRYFEKSNGEAWIPIMINFIMPNGEEEHVFEIVEKYFKSFSENNGNAVRIWISSPFLEIEDQQEGYYNPVKFRRIDRLLEIAKKYNIKVKFTLQHIRSIANEPEFRDLWSNNTVLSVECGGNFHNLREFIVTPKGKSIYLNRVKALAERYRSNDQIFGWELWNEMDAAEENDWVAFSAEMLDSVKALFPNQLVVQTLGSLHSENAEKQYERLFELENNEYLTVHRYLDPGTAWNQYEQVRSSADQIAATAVQFAYRENMVEPVLMNEIGAVEANHMSSSKLYAIDSTGILAHDMIFAPFFCGAAGCGAMWHWNDYLERQNLWFQYQRFHESIKDLDPVEEKFKPFFLQKDSVRMYGLQGKKNTVIWCRDARNNWQTELVKGIAPETKSNFEIAFRDLPDKDLNEVQSYNPWDNSWSKVTIENEKAKLFPFTRSVVVILNKK